MVTVREYVRLFSLWNDVFSEMFLFHLISIVVFVLLFSRLLLPFPRFISYEERVIRARDPRTPKFEPAQKTIQKEIMKIIPFDFWIHLLVLQLYSNPYLHRYLHQAEACLDLQNLEVFHLMLISFGHLHLFCHLIYHLLLRPSVLQFQLTSVHHLKL